MHTRYCKEVEEAKEQAEQVFFLLPSDVGTELSLPGFTAGASHWVISPAALLCLLFWLPLPFRQGLTV